MIENEELPDPAAILLEAEEATVSSRLLGPYRDAIDTLRDKKKYTFREIAEWLTERGIETDHNAVWREYTRHASDSAAHDELEADERAEREEAEESAR